MDPVVTVVISAAASIAVALVGAFVARRKGLPAINAEIEGRMQQLVDTLQDQVTALKTDFENCRGKLQETLVENASIRRELRATQYELLDLYRRTGTQPPRDLENRVTDA